MQNDQDKHYMRLALALAKKGLYTSKPNPRVGCVIVKDDVIVGEGWHAQAGGPRSLRLKALEPQHAVHNCMCP